METHGRTGRRTDGGERITSLANAVGNKHTLACYLWILEEHRSDASTRHGYRQTRATPKRRNHNVTAAVNRPADYFSRPTLMSGPKIDYEVYEIRNTKTDTVIAVAKLCQPRRSSDTQPVRWDVSCWLSCTAAKLAVWTTKLARTRHSSPRIMPPSRIS